MTVFDGAWTTGRDQLGVLESYQGGQVSAVGSGQLVVSVKDVQSLPLLALGDDVPKMVVSPSARRGSHKRGQSPCAGASGLGKHTLGEAVGRQTLA